MENLKLKNKLIALKILYNDHSVYFQVDLIKCYFYQIPLPIGKLRMKIMFGLRVQYRAMNLL